MNLLDAAQILERKVCQHCGIEPRIISGFECKISDCPKRTIKIRKTRRAWIDWRGKNREKKLG